MSAMTTKMNQAEKFGNVDQNINKFKKNKLITQKTYPRCQKYLHM
jgi:hypothetical protein